MVDKPQSLSGHRRVRTGCLTCRKRRRKCDEGKPECQNCLAKNLACRYGLNLTFVDSRPQGNAEVPAATGTKVSFRHFVPVPASRLERSQTPAAPIGDLVDRLSPDAADDPIRLQQLQGDDSQSHDDAAVTWIGGQAPDSASFLTYQLEDEFHNVAHGLAPPRQQEPISPATFNKLRPFARASSHLHPWTPAESSISPLFAFHKEQNSTIEGPAHPSSSSLTGGSSDNKELYELELLTYYRYHIAPRLDLGVGDSYYGVRVLHRAVNSPQLYFTILALSSYQRANTMTLHQGEDQVSTRGYSLQANENLDLMEDEDRWATMVLLTLLDMLPTRPRLWQERITFSQHSIVVQEVHGLLEGPWQVMVRLILAGRLMTSPGAPMGDLTFVVQGVTSVLPTQALTHQQQLRQALSILGRALLISSRESTSEQARTLPMNALWQSCWSENELWVSARNVELRQIFEVMDNDLPLSQPPSSHPALPVIMFSNSCALIANLTHHLTALYLLQHKPRLIKAIANVGSSTSPGWHAQRLVGIVASFADEAEVFDPFVVAAVLYAARRLSHPTQLARIVGLLRKAERCTGMRLDEEIHHLEAAYTLTTSS